MEQPIEPVMDTRNCEFCQEPLTDTTLWYTPDCRHRVVVCSDECRQALEQFMQRRKNVLGELQQFKEQLIGTIRARRRKSVRLEAIRRQLERLYQMTP